MNRMSSIARLAWLARLAPLACAPVLASVAQAQTVDTYPSKQIKLAFNIALNAANPQSGLAAIAANQPIGGHVI